MKKEEQYKWILIISLQPTLPLG